MTDEAQANAALHLAKGRELLARGEDPDLARADREASLHAATAELTRAIELAPDEPDAYFERGHAANELYYTAEDNESWWNAWEEDFVRAKALLLEAIARTPEDSQLHRRLADVLAAMGEEDEAISARGQAVSLAPDDPELNTELAWALSFRGDLETSLPHALHYFARAIELAPKSARPLALRGDALSRAGRYEEALADCDRALALGTSDPREVHRARGSALLGLHRLDEARAAFRAAYGAEPIWPVELRPRQGAKGGDYIELLQQVEAPREHWHAASWYLRPEAMYPFIACFVGDGDAAYWEYGDHAYRGEELAPIAARVGAVAASLDRVSSGDELVAFLAEHGGAATLISMNVDFDGHWSSMKDDLRETAARLLALIEEAERAGHTLFVRGY